MRELDIDLDDLVTEATWNRDSDLSPYSFLDTQTGQILLISPEVWSEAEDEAATWIEPLDEEQTAAQRVCQDYDEEGARYRSLPELESDESYRFMEEFTYGHTDGTIQQRLLQSLAKRKPFRQFKDALLQYPEVREQWFAYEAERHREWVIRWLRSLGIAPKSNVIEFRRKA